MKKKIKNGADDGNRTRDIKLGKLALYQLSYIRPLNNVNDIQNKRKVKPLLAGL